MTVRDVAGCRMSPDEVPLPQGVRARADTGGLSHHAGPARVSVKFWSVRVARSFLETCVAAWRLARGTSIDAGGEVGGVSSPNLVIVSVFLPSPRLARNPSPPPPHPCPLATVTTAGLDTAVSLYDPGDRVGFRGRLLLRDPGCSGRVCGVSPSPDPPKLAGATWLGRRLCKMESGTGDTLSAESECPWPEFVTQDLFGRTRAGKRVHTS